MLRIAIVCVYNKTANSTLTRHTHTHYYLPLEEKPKSRWKENDGEQETGNERGNDSIVEIK